MRDHFDVLDPYEQERVLVRLSERLRSGTCTTSLEQCARALIRKSSGAVKRAVAANVGPLHEAVLEQLSASRSVATVRLVAARDDLTAAIRETLTHHRDGEVRRLASAGATLDVQTMCARVGETDATTLARWCRTSIDFAEKVLDGGATTAYERFVASGVGVEEYLLRTATGKCAAHLHWLISTCTNQPDYIRGSLERYLEEAELSSDTAALVIDVWGSTKAPELEAYILEHYITPATAMRDLRMDGYIALSRRYVKLETDQWRDAATLHMALRRTHTRVAALASELLDGEALCEQVDEVLALDVGHRHARLLRSREASALAWNPNLTSGQADALSEVLDGADVLSLHHAPLSTHKRVDVLRRSPAMQEVLCYIYSAQGLLAQELTWVHPWFDREVLELLLTPDSFKSNNGSVLVEDLIAVTLERYPDMLDRVASMARIDDTLDEAVIVELLNRMSVLGEDPDAATALSGLIAGWQGTIDQLIRTARKL